ncbi:MAG: DUF3089 domain-containing protein [Chloroflexota bacterium]
MGVEQINPLCTFKSGWKNQIFIPNLHTCRARSFKVIERNNKDERKKILVVLMALMMSIPLTACGNEITPTDYSKPEHWMNLPTAIDKPVDIFYLYPTSWQRASKDDPYYSTIDNPMMLKNAKLNFDKQATAFAPVGNIYAPYYRQDDAGYTLSLSVADQAKVVGGIPKTDSIAAFDYYINHYNNGRPFILAGHSQGSILLGLLLSEYMKANPKVYARMIAAYVIGASITAPYLADNPHLKFAEGPDDTGVIISYNTEAPTISAPNPMILPGALVINPISWTRTETVATADQNLGSIAVNSDGTVVFDKDGNIPPVKNLADARVDLAKGALITSTPDIDKFSASNGAVPKGIYHTSDYSFYYYNIRENAANRTKIYLSQH